MEVRKLHRDPALTGEYTAPNRPYRQTLDRLRIRQGRVSPARRVGAPQQDFCWGVSFITRACAVGFLGCRHVPDSGGKHGSSFGSSRAPHFDGMAQECACWLTGCVGIGAVADPGSVTDG